MTRNGGTKDLEERHTEQYGYDYEDRTVKNRTKHNIHTCNEQKGTGVLGSNWRNQNQML